MPPLIAAAAPLKLQLISAFSPLDYFDTGKPRKGSFPRLKPSLKSVSIRLPEDLLIELKNLANKQDVPYQSLMKTFLARQVAIERKSRAGRGNQNDS